MESKNLVVTTIEESKVETSTAIALQNAFMPFFEKANEWAEKAKSLVVTDATEVSKMKEAREARLIMRGIRIEADKVRKALKEDSLRYGKAVQGVYNVIEYLIVPIEEHLEKQEKFAEIKEQERQEALRVAREAEIAPYSEFIPYCENLGKIKSEDYDRMLNIAKAQKEFKEKEEVRLIQEAKEKAEAEEKQREAMRLENERLKAEKAEADAKAEAERIKAQKAIEAERAERAKVEAELKSKAEKEKAEADAKAEAERKANSAPDIEKLVLLASQIKAFELPSVSTPEAKKVIAGVSELLNKVSAYILQNAK